MQQSDATDHPLPDQAARNVWFTDPPYYDAIPYTRISPTFFLSGSNGRCQISSVVLRDPFDQGELVVPQDCANAVWNRAKRIQANGRPKDRSLFRSDYMAKAFKAKDTESCAKRRWYWRSCLCTSEQLRAGKRCSQRSSLEAGWTSHRFMAHRYRNGLSDLRARD